MSWNRGEAPFGGAVVLAKVESVEDPDGLGRIQISYPLHAESSLAWAPVAVPFAGKGYGAYFIPDVGEIVVAAFLNNDSRTPVVMGAVWHGKATPTESAGSSIDRWVLTSKSGTRVAIEDGGQPKVVIETPSGASLTVSDEGGGTVTVETGGTSLTLSPTEVAIKSVMVKVDCTVFELNSAIANIHAPLANFDAVINSQVCLTTTVVSSTYTPGAGNML